MAEANKFTVVAGAVYQLSITVSARTAGRITVKVGNTGLSWTTTATTLTANVVAANTNEFVVASHASEGFAGTVDAISCKRVYVEDLQGSNNGSLHS